ncbi:MAG: hypothetical protein AAGB31_06965 [Bdellovibrio sp.]
MASKKVNFVTVTAVKNHELVSGQKAVNGESPEFRVTCEPHVGKCTVDGSYTLESLQKYPPMAVIEAIDSSQEEVIFNGSKIPCGTLKTSIIAYMKTYK